MNNLEKRLSLYSEQLLSLSKLLESEADLLSTENESDKRELLTEMSEDLEQLSQKLLLSFKGIPKSRTVEFCNTCHKPDTPGTLILGNCVGCIWKNPLISDLPGTSDPKQKSILEKRIGLAQNGYKTVVEGNRILILRINESQRTILCTKCDGEFFEDSFPTEGNLCEKCLEKEKPAVWMCERCEVNYEATEFPEGGDLCRDCYPFRGSVFDNDFLSEEEEEEKREKKEKKEKPPSAPAPSKRSSLEGEPLYECGKCDTKCPLDTLRKTDGLCLDCYSSGKYPVGHSHWKMFPKGPLTMVCSKCLRERPYDDYATGGYFCAKCRTSVGKDRGACYMCEGEFSLATLKILDGACSQCHDDLLADSSKGSKEESGSLHGSCSMCFREAPMVLLESKDGRCPTCAVMLLMEGARGSSATTATN